MKIKHYLLAGLTLLSPLALQSCFDSNYDLSDIDTTVRLKTTELTVPLNLDVLTLEQVMDIDDDSDIVEDINPETGERIYAIKREGDFESERITVKAFDIEEPQINPTEAPIGLTTDNLQDDVDGCYIILDEIVPPATFSTLTEDIDKSIHSIKGLGGNTNISTNLTAQGLGGFIEKSLFENLILKYPAGLRASYVDKQSGKVFKVDPDGYLDLSTIAIKPDLTGTITIEFDVDSIDATRGNITFDPENHTLLFEDEVKIVQGDINLRGVDPKALPAAITFVLNPKIYDIHVYSFSGAFEYDVEHFSIDPIDLTSLPDFLNQTGTKIKLENPQIYLSISNPLNKYDVGFESGFQLTAVAGDETNGYRPDEDTDSHKAIEITSTEKDEEGNYLPNEIVMAPTDPKHYYEGYTDPTYIKFSGLRDILAETGDGIPHSVEVSIIDPRMPAQEVDNFRLGDDLDPVQGTYAFYAPLQLTEGSHIAYTDTINGWNDEDVDALTFSKIVVSFDATTDLPYSVELSIIPITLDDKDIKNVTSSKVTLEANAKNHPVNLTIEGAIEHLDGIKIKANVMTERADTMSPDMKLYIKNSKIILTGYYEKEL